MRITIQVKGAAEIARKLGDPNLLSGALGPGLRRAGVILEAGWKRRVHTVTRKAQGSLGHKVEGTTLRVGPQPGYGSPRKYSRAQTGAWKKPRDGVNRGDPREYLIFEDQGTRYRPGHPSAEPALDASRDQVIDAIVDSLRKQIERL